MADRSGAPGGGVMAVGGAGDGCLDSIEGVGNETETGGEGGERQAY